MKVPAEVVTRLAAATEVFEDHLSDLSPYDILDSVYPHLGELLDAVNDLLVVVRKGDYLRRVMERTA